MDKEKSGSAAESKEEILIPVKINNSIRKLTTDEAAELAQKGLKFEMIAADFEFLKKLASENQKSVSEFLNSLKQSFDEARMKELCEKSGGNEELAEYVLKLENGKERGNGFEELKSEFPEIRELTDLPEEVVEKSKLCGTLLLDEYLRFKHFSKKKADRTAAKNAENSATSLGSQTDCRRNMNPEAEEFLKGLWK